MATTLINNGDGAFEWNAIGNENGDSLQLVKGGAQLAVHCFGTFGGTLTMQGSIDGTNWFTLLTGPGGSEITFTADGYAEVTTAAKYIRPSGGTGVSDVDVHVHMVA